MEFDKQLQTLRDDAPKYGVPAMVMERGVIPVLVAFASQLQHLDYYVSQNFDGNWVVTTLSHRSSPEVEKKVIYAFANLKDAATLYGKQDLEILAQPVPVVHILFELFSLQQVDSVIFIENPGNLNRGTEIKRSHLKQTIQQQLKQLRSNSQPTPPNIA